MGKLEHIIRPGSHDARSRDDSEQEVETLTQLPVWDNEEHTADDNVHAEVKLNFKVHVAHVLVGLDAHIMVPVSPLHPQIANWK